MSKKKQKGINKSSLTNKILSIFNEDPLCLLNYKQIAKLLYIKDTGTKKLISVCLNEMTERNELIEVYRGKFKLKTQGAFIIGRVDLTSRGSAYIVSDEIEKDIFVSQKHLHHALDGDLVKIYVYAKKRRNHVEGEVVEIVERKRSVFVGIIEVAKHFAFLIPERNQIAYDIFIPLEKLKNAKSGEKAIVKILEWKQNQKNPVGEVVEVLGKPENNEVEMHAILAEFGLPYKYPKKVEEAAEEIDDKISYEELNKRKDFRQITTFTIDPEDAKDFDDALSFRTLTNGNVEVGIHIADVTHYVRTNTIIETEAYERATSIYLVDRVLPMLPERLSNEICSLRPNEEKLCFSAVFEMNEKAEIINSWLGKTVIQSDQRFTYEEAQKIIETQEGTLNNAILKLHELAQILRAERFKKGAISFERSEVKFRLDDDAKPIDVYIKENKESNQLIEEFMLLANKKVAEFVGKPDGKKNIKTFVYRIHDEPNQDKLNRFSYFIKRFGYTLQTKSKKKIAQSINNLLTEVQGKKEQNVLETLAIRTMAKAEYSTKNLGHYGLAFDYYSHFTSPIRRYPDMMVHRMLEHYLQGGKSYPQETYEKMCKHSSEMEQLASLAERASIKYKQVEFMKNTIGETFNGVVSGVTQWGIYVEIEENKCEGMISVRSLKDDFYEYDEAEYALIGEKTKKRYTLGDNLTIRVVNANLSKKQLDFELID